MLRITILFLVCYGSLWKYWCWVVYLVIIKSGCLFLFKDYGIRQHDVLTVLVPEKPVLNLVANHVFLFMFSCEIPVVTPLLN